MDRFHETMSSSEGASSSLAGSSFRVPLQQLRWCGYGRLPARGPRALHDHYRVLSLAATTLYVIQMCIYAYQERSDIDKVAQVMSLLLCHITSVAKQVVFFVDADRIDHLVASMDDPLYNQSEPQHRALLEEAARGADRLARAFTAAAIGVCTLWIIFPIVDYVRGQPVEFHFWVYIEYSRPVEFTLVLLYSYYVTTLVGIGDTTMDTFMATVLKQCKIQLTILRINIENMTNYAECLSRNSDTNETFENALKRRFQDCLTHYRKIYETTRLFQDIFGSAILMHFGIGGWILCMAAFRIVSLNVLSIEFASMTLFICCMLTELFLYCYYGNEVTAESDLVSASLYAMEWLQTPARFRRSLLVVMERAKRPLRPAAGRVIPLSLDTFLKIIRSSYSFYAVLRQTK